MIPKRPLDNGPGIRNLADQYCPRHTCRGLAVIRPSVLLPPQQDISRDRSLYPGQKPAVLGQKAQSDATFSAKTIRKGCT